MKLLRHLSSFIAPIIIGFGLPYLIVAYQQGSYFHIVVTSSPGMEVLGFFVGIAGLLLLMMTVRMFILIGKGTIMPWDPTRNLITSSLYGHVRNPMILGVLTIQLGEGLLFGSYGVILLAVSFFIINTVYFIYFEEPGLGKRFGREYIEYKHHVPRWIPRIKAWHPGQEKSSSKITK